TIKHILGSTATDRFLRLEAPMRSTLHATCRDRPASPHDETSCASRAACLSVSGHADGGRAGPQSCPRSWSAALPPVTLVPFCSSARISSKGAITSISLLAPG